MHLYAIVIVAIVLAADGLSVGVGGIGVGGGVVTAIALAVPAVLLLVQQIAVQWCMRRSRRRSSMRAIIAAGRLSRAVRGLMIANHGIVVLGLGWLSVIRSWTGDLILVDELIAMLPPVVGFAGSWWVDYPLERRLRDAMLIRRLDRGAPVYPTPGRGGHVLMQMRLQLLPLLAPLLLIAAFGEIIRWAAGGVGDDDARFWIGEGATMIAALGVFIIAPLLARVLLSVRRLQDGELRTALLDVCKAHGVKVREILIWDTGGVMINAAVMGLVAPLRYVMLTDALLDAMDRRELVAVMAHEIGHVRRHHMPWMVLGLLAALTAASVLVTGPVMIVWWVQPGLIGSSQAVEVVSTIAALGVAAVAFGWMSRRFERQADTFAAQHLSAHPLVRDVQEAAGTVGSDEQEDVAAPVNDDSAMAGEGRITAAAVSALQSALRTIARLNMIDPKRRSWRHGSMSWRDEYLETLIGRRADRLAIDRVVRRLKVCIVLVLAVGLALQAVLWVIEDGAVAGENQVDQERGLIYHGEPQRAMSVEGEQS